MATTSPQEILIERFSEPGVSSTPWSQVEAVLESAELFWLFGSIRRSSACSPTPSGVARGPSPFLHGSR